MNDVAGIFGPFPASTVLDSSGIGSVTLQAKGQKLQIISTRVKCSSAVKEAVARIYRGTQGYEVEGSLAGSTGDTSDTVFYLNDGDVLTVVWTGGDVGATATAIFSGWASVPGSGFRAVH